MVGESFWQTPASASTSVAVAGVSTHELADAAPKSVYINGPHAAYDADADRTYVAYLGLDRNCYIVQFSHATGDISDPVKIGDRVLGDPGDNHGAPTIAIDQSGHIHVVWGSHGAISEDTQHRHSKSDAPHDISAWTTQAMTGGGTYPRLVVADNGDLLLFDRAGQGNGSTFPSKQFIAVRRSTDQWNWTGHTGIISAVGNPDSGASMYLHGATLVGDLVHLSWTILMGGPATGNDREDVYHATYDVTTGNLATIGGTDLGSQITWAEHSAVRIFTGFPIYTMTHLALAADKVFVAYGTGTDPTPGYGDAGFEGEFTWRVAAWDGSSWTTTDTGIPFVYYFSQAVLARWGDVIIGLFPTRSSGETRTRLAAWISPDGVSWHDSGTVLEPTTGEGWERIGPIAGDGRLIALAQQLSDGWSDTDATASDLLPIHAIEGLPAPSPHGNEHHSEEVADVDHVHDYAEPDHTHEGVGEVVFAPDYTVTDGSSLDLAVTFVWGIDGGGDPYYNSAGVTAGDEAVLVLDNSTGAFSLRPVEV